MMQNVLIFKITKIQKVLCSVFCISDCIVLGDVLLRINFSDKLICSVDAKYIVFNIIKFKFERKGGHGFQVYSVHDINVKKTFLIFQKSIFIF